jgi:hypothetical protein
MDAACLSGLCVDAFCCDAECTGQCEACDVGALEGTCSPVAGEPHGARTACASDSSVCGGACDGIDRATCFYPGDTVPCRAGSCTDGVAILAEACQGSGACPAERTQTCALYVCVGDLCGGDCTVDTDCDPGSYCSGGICVARLANGESCASDEQCVSALCVDGVCCDGACTAQCEACDVAGAEGACSAVTGTPHGGRAACTGTGDCGGACDGTMRTACTFPGAGIECSDPECSAGQATAAGTCEGTGGCAVPAAVPCDPYVCGATACLTECAATIDCADGYECVGTACLPPGADADADADADAGADSEADADADGDATGDVEVDGAGDVPTDGEADAAPPSSGGGCGCVVAGSAGPSSLAAWLGATFGVAVLFLRWRRRIEP